MQVGRIFESMSFQLSRRLKGFEVPDRPFLDARASEVFEQMLSASKYYLEYGSGGSTVLAARLNKAFLSIDNDRVFVKAVQRKIGELQGDQTLYYLNTGMTGRWGYPLIHRRTAARLAAWRSYVWEPWRIVEKQGRSPDLVMVDGRFRVAASLVSILHLQRNLGATLLLDDYVGRPHYRIVQDFAQLVEKTDRLAVFRIDRRDEDKLRATLSRYETDFR